MRIPADILLPFLCNRFLRVSHEGIMNDYHEYVGKYSEIARHMLEQFEEYELLSQVYEDSKHADYDEKYFFFVINAKEMNKSVIFIPRQESYTETYCQDLADQCEFEYATLEQAVIDNR